jgi:microcystin-dependent protein
MFAFPTATSLPYWGDDTDIPTGWLLMDGSSVLRASYPALFAKLGVKYGSVDGTHFNLPNPNGRVLAGKDRGAGLLTTVSMVPDGETDGAVGGEQRHTLTISEMPVHNHDLNDLSHTHNQSDAVVGSGLGGTPGGDIMQFLHGAPGDATFSSFSNITVVVAGGSGAHNNVQGTIICNWIIKT